jgi:hypothetical protein
VLLPQEAQVAENISLFDDPPPNDLPPEDLPPDDPPLPLRAERQSLHRVGSLVKPFSA